MRLTKKQINSIQSTAQSIFGKSVRVFLFGSRIDDTLKGGDIDLLINADENDMKIKKKALFLVELKNKIGNQKIDVIFDKEETEFIKMIKQNCISLC